VINNLLGEDQGSSSLDPVLCLHNNGSFLDNVEMPPAARMGIMANIARNHHIREVVLETRANSVTREMLVEIRHIMAPKRVVMAMGLENANDEIRDLCIHKGLSWRAFERGQGLSP